jgi:hypothetical protein
VLNLTPRQLSGWVYFARISKSRAQAEAIAFHRIAAHGKREDVDKAMKQLLKES